MGLNNLPKDSVMLLSVVNTKLRDYYDNLSMLCEDLNVEEAEIIAKLQAIDYEYDEQKNQFV